MIIGSVKSPRIKIKVKMLRAWLCSQTGELGVQGRTDAFVSRVQKSVLARHFTGYSSGGLSEYT